MVPHKLLQNFFSVQEYTEPPLTQEIGRAERESEYAETVGSLSKVLGLSLGER